MLETFWEAIFFKVKHPFGHISGIAGPIDVKREGRASIGYWVYYVTLNFDLAHELDLDFFKVKFRNSCISEIVGLIDMKWKGSELTRYWAECMTFPFDHPHPWPWPWRFKIRVWNDLISGMGRLIDMERKRRESSIHYHANDLSVTMVRWVDVPDCDRGGFKRRRAVNTSCWYLLCICTVHDINLYSWVVLCFVVAISWVPGELMWPILSMSFRVVQLVLGKSYDCPSVIEASLKYMSLINWQETTNEWNKTRTLCNRTFRY